MKSLFCLLLLAIFYGSAPTLAAKIVSRSSTTSAVTPLHASPEVRLVRLNSTPGVSVGTLSSGFNDADQRTALAKRLLSALPPAATDKRYSLKERLVLKYLRKQIKKLGMREGEPADPRKLRLGRLALILGAGAFVVAFIPFLQILSPLMAIAAVALGIVSVQGNSNLPGILGICFGGAFILLILAVVAIFVLTFSFW